jgi:excisionase family DNA binding protein
MENPFDIIIQRLDAIEQLLYEIKTGKQVEIMPVAYSNELMNVQQVAEYLTLSVQTIYGLVHKMEIPNAKLGKRLYFKKSEIEDWISRSRRKTRVEIEQEASKYLLRNRKCEY